MFGLLAGVIPDAHAEGLCARLRLETVPPSSIHTGFFRGHPITYAMIAGQPVTEGDILLDHVDDLSGFLAKSARPAAGRTPDGIATAVSSFLWPKVAGIYTIPYAIAAGSTANISAAVEQFNTTFNGFMQFVPRTTQADYVDFDLIFPPGSTCYSYIGRIGGPQTIQGGDDCPIPSLIHEMGHATGLYHEQSRGDRDSFVTFNLANVIDGDEWAYVQPTENAQNLGSYDFASIMMYYPEAFSRNGKVTMESKPAGIEFGQGQGYSAGDIDTIRRIYGAPPKTVTIASLPSGLTVTIDGVAYRTPKIFNWPLNSTHTLAVAATAQSVGGESYIYGRWSDQTAASHSITVTPGIGTPAEPKTSPALTVYTAAFVHLAKFSPIPSISGGGAITASPVAKSYAGATGLFYPVRLPVTYTAQPAAGFVFAGWGEQTPNALNPIPGLSSDFVFAYFEPAGTPLTTIATNPAGVGLLVDGVPAYGPSLFPWAVGSSHALSTTFPYGSPNTRSVFVSWSDKGASTHAVIGTSTPRTLTAVVKQQFSPYLSIAPTCAASLKFTPASTDGFYDSGTALQISSLAQPGWVFAGWTDDLAKASNPAKFTVTGELRATALYNTIAAPLKIAGFNPASLPTGSSVRTLTVMGTGFTPASQIFANGISRTTQYVSATKLTFPLTAADVTNPNALDILVVNGPSGSSCSVYDGREFFVMG